VPKSIPKPTASLQRHFLWVLLSVAGMFAAGIALSLWFSLQSNRETQQYLIQVEAEQARSGLLRQLDYYRRVVDKSAQDPELTTLLRSGTLEAQQQWALSRQKLLPDLLGMALVNRRGEVLGDPSVLRVGARCQEGLQREGALAAGRLLLHLDQPGLEHVELLSAVRDVGGHILGGVFLSVRLSQLQRVIKEASHPGHAMSVVDAAGNTIASTGTVGGALWEVSLPVADTGWTLVAQAPVQWLTVSGGRQVLAGLLTLGAVLLLLAVGMLWLRRTMLRDIVATRDALDALAHEEPPPTIMPHYVEFEPVVADINLIALHLQEQRARLAHLSLTDPLTGLPNRRAFETYFPQALGMAERRHPVALVMLDIDRFKGINDRFGHGVGDQVLLALAHALKDLTRRADLSARLAGDEFAVLLADTDASGLDAWYQRLADRFRSELNAFGLEIQTGLSAGQTWLASEAGDTMNAALARADRALYQAKARGRGQLVQDTAPAADGAE
jgi:diguanylate cyclase (GGDEF)-like protein